MLGYIIHKPFNWFFSISWFGWVGILFWVLSELSQVDSFFNPSNLTQPTHHMYKYIILILIFLNYFCILRISFDEFRIKLMHIT